MENSQWKWISLGLISMSGLAYCLNQLNKQKKQYQEKLDEFNQVHTYSKTLNNKYIQQIMTDNKYGTRINEKKFQFFTVKPIYNKDTFKLYERERSLYKQGSKYSPHQILQNQMGGQFMFIHPTIQKTNFGSKQRKQNVRVILNDFNFPAKLLRQQKTDVKVFQGKNNIQPIVCTVVSTLVSGPLAIYGSLYFDNNKLTWTIQPLFISDSFNMQNIVKHYYDQKIGNVILSKFGIVITGLILSYWTIIKPLIKYIQRKRQQRKGNKLKQYANDIDYFKDKDYILVKGENLLNCQKCKNKNVQIIYQCGHLSLCIECHQRNYSKTCPLCHKESKKFMKIYMA